MLRLNIVYYVHMTKHRYRFTVEYDGTGFDNGWQKQKTQQTSVQGVLEEAVTLLIGQHTVFYCAGRTDKHVHALGQVVHADFPKIYPLKMLHDGMNFYLKNYKCRVLSVEPVSADFHARFLAKRKTYLYRVVHSRTYSVFDMNQAWWISTNVTLDLDKAKDQVTYLVGHHDFSSFRDSSCQALSPIRTLESATIESYEKYIDFTFVSKSFLHKQIRIMTGTLIDLARGRLGPLENILQAKNRASAGQTAPGHGLFLKNIEYL